MKRLALVALVALAVVPAALASEARPTLADLEDEIMCPVCPGETLEQSSSPAALQVERLIAVRIRAGDSKQEIKDRLVDQYGPKILAAPPKEGFDLLAWVLPLVGAARGRARARLRRLAVEPGTRAAAARGRARPRVRAPRRPRARAP